MRSSAAKRIPWIRTGWALSLSLAQLILSAQNPVVFESTGPTREVPEGSTFEVSFSLKNATGKRFIAPDFKGFQVTGGPVEMRGAGFINGQSYSNQSWSYELEAGKPGTYTIGPATVQTANQTLRSQPLTIRVGQARQQRPKSASNSTDRFFVSGELDHEQAWVGQQIHYQVKLYTQVNVTDFDILDLPEFNAFYSLDRQRFDTRTQYETIKGKRYAVRVLHEVSLFPQESGEVTIGAARVRLGVEQPGSISSLFGSTPVLAQTQPVKLKVKPLPEPAPAGFSGAVGHYEWKVSADKNDLSTDDALTLTVTVQGNGDARRFANPHFVWPDGLEGFDPKVHNEEEYETGDQYVHARTLEYVLLPKQPGDYSLSPQLIVFDPDSSRYCTLSGGPSIQVHVTAGAHFGEKAPLPDTLSAPAPTQSPLAAFWQNTLGWLRSPLLWSSLGGLALAVLLFFAWKKRRQNREQRAAQPRPVSSRSMLKEARERLAQVAGTMQNGDSRVFCHELLKALEHYLAIRLDIQPADLNKETLQEKLQSLQVSESTTTAFLQVWQACEQAVFAGQARDADMGRVWYQAEGAVQELEDFFRSGKG